MGYYDTTQLPIYKYLHAHGAPNYVIADRFFQAAFGGSFLNHQYLIAAAPPLFPAGQHSVLDSAGYPATVPLYASDATKVNGAVTQACGLPTTVPGLACGDYAVNTVLPWYQPTASFRAQDSAHRRHEHPNDHRRPPLGRRRQLGLLRRRLGQRGRQREWSGLHERTRPHLRRSRLSPGFAGWRRQPGRVSVLSPQVVPAAPLPLRVLQPLRTGPTGSRSPAGRSGLPLAAKNGGLPAVSFVKPLGTENEHPGYTSEPNGSDHLVDLIKADRVRPRGRQHADPGHL